MHAYEISSNQLSSSKQNSARRHFGHTTGSYRGRQRRETSLLLTARSPLGLRTLTHCLPQEFISVLELGF